MAEVCSDNADNDCDGATDEADAVDASTWYQDCDGDGYASGVAITIKSCVTPPTTASCKAWTTRAPNDASSTDCNDASTAYHPGASFDYVFTPGMAPANDSSGFDLNCDGKAELEPNYTNGPFAIFDFGSGNPKQYVSACDASSTGCCVTSFQGVAFCCGCNLGIHVECGGYRGDTSGYFLCR